MGLRAVIFDLDNTLYPEADFVAGGLRAAASVCATAGCDSSQTLARLYQILTREGRGHVFDMFVSERGLPESLVTAMISAYRGHDPRLSLYLDADSALKMCAERGYRTGIVTDGHSSVQRSKISALKLEERVDVIICTDEIGDAYHKPSVLPFEMAMRQLGVGAWESVYIGDDASKDFAGPNELGMVTVQVVRKVRFGFSGTAMAESYSPRAAVPDLVTAVQYAAVCYGERV